MNDSAQTSTVVVRKEQGDVFAEGSNGQVIASGSSDVRVAQDAYDAAFGDSTDGQFLFGPATWELDDSFVHYQSGVTVSAPSARFEPAGSYSGYLIEWKTTEDTITGDPDNIFDSYLRGIKIDGNDQAKGIYMETVLSSELGPNVYLYDTAGPALRLANTIRHVNFWGPHIRYGGSSIDAALEIGPDRKLGWEGDASNHNYFYGLHNVFPDNTGIRIFNDDRLNDLNPVRGFKFYGGQWHGNPNGTYEGRPAQTKPMVEILGAANIGILGPNVRNAGGPENGVIYLGTGEDGRKATAPIIGGATAISSKEGFGIQVESGGLTGEMVLDDLDIGQWSHVPKVIDWGDGDYVCKWGSVTYEYVADTPFSGSPPRIEGREPNRDVLCGWYENWSEGRGRMRTNGRSYVTAAETYSGGTPDHKLLSPVTNYSPYKGQAQFGRDAMLLENGDGVCGEINQLFDTMSWDLAFACGSDPSSGSLQFWPFFDPTEESGWRVDLSYEGRYELRWVGSGDSEEIVLSEYVCSPAKTHNNLQVRRNSNARWELSHNDSRLSTATDSRMPSRREFAIVNELDASVEIGDIVAY